MKAPPGTGAPDSPLQRIGVSRKTVIFRLPRPAVGFVLYRNSATRHSLRDGAIRQHGGDNRVNRATGATSLIKPSKWRAAAVAVLSLAVSNLGLVSASQAGIVATSAIVRTDRAADMALIRTQLDQAEVKAQMEKLGVDAANVDARIAALSDSELHSLAKQMQEAPAGGDFLALLGVVFVVLLILELVGVIDIFKKN